MSEIKQWDETYVADTYARFPVCLTKGSGAQLWDEDGKSYIDMGSGIGVNTFGISDEVWVKAVTEQLTQLTHTSNLYYTKPCAELAKLLCEKTGMKKVFFANSGAEANECAIKAARKYAAKTLGEDHFYIITLEGSFHGRTITTLAATGQAVFHEQFQPLTPGFVYAKPGDLQHMEELLEKYPCAAVMLEPVQGEGGVCALEFDYLRKVQEAAHRHGALLIVDEVQCGNGRTGTLYAYEQSGLSPDIVTTAKVLAGACPLVRYCLQKKQPMSIRKVTTVPLLAETRCAVQAPSAFCSVWMMLFWRVCAKKRSLSARSWKMRRAFFPSAALA